MCACVCTHHACMSVCLDVFICLYVCFAACVHGFAGLCNCVYFCMNALVCLIIFENVRASVAESRLLKILETC